MRFFDDSLITFHGDLIDFFEKNKSSIVRGLCPNCGYELSSYIETGRLGCSKCYDTFREHVLRQLRSAGYVMGKQ